MTEPDEAGPGEERVSPVERRATLTYTAGELVWSISVPLESATIGSAVIALPPAFTLLVRRLRPDWDRAMSAKRKAAP